MKLKSKSSIYEIEHIISQKDQNMVCVAFKKSMHYSIQQKVILKLFNSHSKIYPLELDSLIQVQSPYCVSVLHFELIENKPALILEWIDGLNLFQFIQYSHPLDQDFIDCLCWQIQQGLLDLKKYNLCHGDLSLHNILIDKKGYVRLIDFGKGNYFEDEVVGTPGFIAQEVLHGENPNFYSDLFSLGVIEQILNGKINIHHDRENPSLSIERDPLLSPLPQNRRIKDYFFNHETQNKLGKQVTKIIKQNQILFKKTTPLSITRSKKSWHPSFVLCAILLFSFFSSGISQKNYLGSISIRSHKWFRIELKDQFKFTPFASGPLKPGIYKIKWKNKYTQGITIIHLKEGSHIFLTDKDLLSSHMQANQKGS